MGFGEGVEVAGGVGDGDFVEKIVIGESGHRHSFVGSVEIKISVHIDGKTDTELRGDLFSSAEKNVGEDKVLGEADVVASEPIIGLGRFFLAKVVKERGTSANFRKEGVVAWHADDSGSPGGFDGGDGLPSSDHILGIFGVVGVGEPVVGLVYAEASKGQARDFFHELHRTEVI